MVLSGIKDFVTNQFMYFKLRLINRGADLTKLIELCRIIRRLPLKYFTYD